MQTGTCMKRRAEDWGCGGGGGGDAAQGSHVPEAASNKNSAVRELFGVRTQTKELATSSA